MRSIAGLVFAARSDDRGAAFADFCGEVASGVALVAQQCFAAVASEVSSRSRSASIVASKVDGAY
jgi:hypothetical protein